jgi:hypothetical protein
MEREVQGWGGKNREGRERGEGRIGRVEKGWETKEWI